MPNSDIAFESFSGKWNSVFDLLEKGSGFKKDKRKRDSKAPKNGKHDGKKTEKRQ